MSNYEEWTDKEIKTSWFIACFALLAFLSVLFFGNEIRHALGTDTPEWNTCYEDFSDIPCGGYRN